MTVQDQVNPQEEAQKIWDQLDSEEAGGAQPADSAQEVSASQDSQGIDPTAQTPAEYNDGDSADVHASSEEAIKTGEQLLMDKIAGLEAMLGQVTQRLRNAEGHIGGLGSQLKQQQQLAAQITAAGGDAPTASQIRQAQSSPQAMSRLKEDYPEFADAMESVLNEQLQAIRQEMLRQQAQPGVTQEDIARFRSEMSVEVVHPGWQERVRTPEFIGWMQKQPREVQMLAASESPQDAIRLLDLHADARKSVVTQRTQRLNSAAAIPSGRSGASVRQKAVEDMTPEEYWRYLDELDRQKR